MKKTHSHNSGRGREWKKSIPEIREREWNEKIHSQSSGKGIRGLHSWEWPGTGIPAHPWPKSDYCLPLKSDDGIIWVGALNCEKVVIIDHLYLTWVSHMVRKGLKVFLIARRISIAFFLQLTQMTRRVADLNSRVKTAQANITLIQVQKLIVGPTKPLCVAQQTSLVQADCLSELREGFQ